MAAGREALKDFQARVAQRLKVAGEEGGTASWLAVALRDRNCLFPLSQANEVMPSAKITAVPYSKHWFLGAVNSRGRIYGVVDLAAYLAHLTDAAPTAPSTSAQQTDFTLVGMNSELNINCVLVVHSVKGLRSPSAFVAEQEPPPGAHGCWGPLYQDEDGKQWQEINLRNLSRSPDFLSISV